jgi:hypothetical protein
MGERNMLVAKFVDNNYKHDTFGTPIEKNILVLPINEDVDFNSMILDAKSILLEISEENIINCQRNSSFHVNKAIPIRFLNSDELSILRSAVCKNSELAYEYAKYVDKKPTPETRNAAYQNPCYAYKYALHIDKKPTNETRTAVCKDPYYAYLYAKYVDQTPTDETRFAACQHPGYAYNYAKYVDRKPTRETRSATCQHPEYAYYYAKFVDRKPTNETRTNASKDPYYKEKYEHWEKSIC